MLFKIPASLRLLSAGAALLTTSACAAARPASPMPTGARPEPEIVWEAPPAVQPEVRAPERDILGTVQYDLPVEANTWVEAELDFLVGQRAGVVRTWLQRGDYYEPYIKEVLRSHGIPTDLFHLAAIESGFVPTARSHAGAVGMWQFMPATGRAMGLRIEEGLDERMDPVRSTRAAARHLRALHSALGDWALSAAAYNAGSGRITRGMARFGVSDFWALAQLGDLADETRRYVPRLYAVTVIGRDRARFGVETPRPSATFAYDSVQVEYATPLAELARLGAGSEEVLRRLNPHLLGGSTPSGGYWVWVPRGIGPDVQRAWLASEFRRDRGLGTYTVRWGDNLGLLAQRSGLRASRIRELNPSIDFDRLQTGARLTLPHAAVQVLASLPVRTASATATAAPARATAAVAEPAPTAAPARATAAVAEPAPAAAPARATAAVAEPAPAAAPARATAAAAEPAPAAAPARATAAAADPAPVAPSATMVRQAESSPATRSHVVAAGETLWGIAREHGVSVQAIEEANSLSSATIRPGQTLLLPEPARRGNAVASTPATVEHVVSEGESLWGIARRYGSTVEAIQEANELGARPIRPGQTLIVTPSRRAPER